MKLRTKILLIILPVVIISVTSLGFWSYYNSKKNLNEMMDAYLTGMLSSHLSQTIFPHYEILRKNGLDSIKSFVDRYKADAAKNLDKLKLRWPTHSFIVEKSGEVIFCSSHLSQEVHNNEWGSVIYFLKTKDLKEHYGIHETKNGKFFYKVIYFEPWDWYVFLSIEYKYFSGALEEIALGTTVVGIISAVIIILVLAVFFSRFIIKPLNLLRNTSRMIAKCKMKVSINSLYSEEFDSLSDSVVEMSEEIEKNSHMLENWNKELESKINERTKQLDIKNNQLRHEIAVRKQTEEDLRDAIKRFEDIVQGTTNLVTIVDGQGRYLFVNHAAEKVFGIAPKELIGCSAFENIYEEDKYFTIQAFNGWVINKKENATFENRLIGKDGEIREMLWNVNINYHEDGSVNIVNSIARDMTEEKKVRKKVEESEELNRAILNSLSAHVCILDDKGFIINTNTAWKKFAENNTFDGHGYGEGVNYVELCMNSFGAFSNGSDSVGEGIVSVINGKCKEFNHVYECSSPMEQRWFHMKVSRVEGIQPVKVVIAHENITEIKKTEQKLKELSETDGLTGIANRRVFNETIEKEWMRAMRNSSPISLIMADIDHFKAYNDTYGHLKGDECLKFFAKTLRSVCRRPIDLPARFGGEEFVILLPDTDALGAEKVAQEFMRVLSELKMSHSGSMVNEFVTASIGISTLVPERGEGCDKIIWFADDALYEAKNSGRNRICVKNGE